MVVAAKAAKVMVEEGMVAMVMAGGLVVGWAAAWNRDRQHV